jgi:hypothetical protein
MHKLVKFYFQNLTPILVSKVLNWSSGTQFTINNNKKQGQVFCLHSLVHPLTGQVYGSIHHGPKNPDSTLPGKPGLVPHHPAPKSAPSRGASQNVPLIPGRAGPGTRRTRSKFGSTPLSREHREPLAYAAGGPHLRVRFVSPIGSGF